MRAGDHGGGTRAWHRGSGGVHTGEVETIDDKVGGVAVAIGSRVSSIAGPSEALVSQTVKDLVAGSGLTFEDAGEHELMASRTVGGSIGY
jgi:class 3 adenylate cyclase